MSNRSSFYLFECSSVEAIVDLIIRAGQDLGFVIRIGENEMPKSEAIFVDQIDPNGRTTILIPSTAYKLAGVCNTIGKHINEVNFNIRLQEGSIWDYTLSRGNEVIDLFSVSANIWDGDSIRLSKYDEWRGNARLVAEVWNVPIDRIDRYLVDWGLNTDESESFLRFSRSSQGKAYETDQWPYGNISQVYDFILALKGCIPDIETRKKLYI